MSRNAVKKRFCLSIETKCKLLKEVDDKVLSKKEIAKKYGVPKSTLSTILKGREKVEKAQQVGIAPARKYSREAKYPQLEKALLAWLRTMRGKNVPVDGNLLKEQAEVFALRLNLTDFKASDGWQQRFKLRHGLTFRKVCGESAAVDLTTTREWKENRLKLLLSEYPPGDVFNADETGLFYKLLPDRTLVFKDETCSGGKRAKQRITVLLGANMTGTEKLPLLIIGKYKNPRCFKNIRSLPAVWEANRKAWMTGDIFERWIRRLDRHFSQKKRKILLVLDNCTAHVEINNLEAIRIEYLPPNVTSVLQPMDQGIIHSFKRNYRRMLLRRVALSFENNQVYDVDVLAAMHLSVRAWDQIQESTIANCFRHAGFVNPNMDADGIERRAEAIQVSAAADDDVLLSAFKKNSVEVPDSLTFEDFSNIDEKIQCTEEISDEDIIQQAVAPAVDSDGVSDADEECASENNPVPTLKEAANAVSVLRRFFENAENTSPCLAKIDSLESMLFKSVNLTQSKITGFFT